MVTSTDKWCRCYHCIWEMCGLSNPVVGRPHNHCHCQHFVTSSTDLLIIFRLWFCHYSGNVECCTFWRTSVFVIPPVYGDNETSIYGRGRPNDFFLLLWNLIFVALLYGTCVMSPLWRLEFRDDSQTFANFVDPWFNGALCNGLAVHVDLFLPNHVESYISCSLVSKYGLVFLA